MKLEYIYKMLPVKKIVRAKKKLKMKFLSN